MSFTGWNKGADYNGTIATSGQTKTGTLRLDNPSTETHYGFLNCSTVDTYISNTRRADNNQGILAVHYPEDQSGIADDLIYCKVRENNKWSKAYNLFGEHNTDLLASTIQTLINNGKITIK